MYPIPCKSGGKLLMIYIEQNDLLGEKEMARVTSIYRLTYIFGV